MIPDTLVVGDIDSDNLVKYNLGEQINKQNRFRLTIPMTPRNKHPNLLDPESFLTPNPDDHEYFYGIEHQDVIATVTFYIYNYENIFKLKGHLDIENNLWRLTPFLIPLSNLIEYSDQMKLEIEVELNTLKKRFYSFDALYLKVEPCTTSRLKLPCYENGVYLEFIANIWTLVKSVESTPESAPESPKSSPESTPESPESPTDI